MYSVCGQYNHVRVPGKRLEPKEEWGIFVRFRKYKEQSGKERHTLDK